ncbi:hypothetical protein EYF80_040390 [Liparis tanakae]|uniref:Uncharacterized protein n=1 Tax=Liparis tanakae TaxID=230148 RepID=A0A4Z2G8M8_9TELE|nr:hypothetical protein EYF80_040390 [Liparis tanakae]
MARQLRGNVLVTGSNRGLGLELLRQLAARGGERTRLYAGCRAPEGAGAQGCFGSVGMAIDRMAFGPVSGRSLMVTPSETSRPNILDGSPSSSSVNTPPDWLPTGDVSLGLEITEYMSDEDSISAAVQAVSRQIGAGGLNLLINNAAINQPAAPAPLAATGKKDMMDVYETNVVGPFLLAKVGVVSLLVLWVVDASCALWNSKIFPAPPRVLDPADRWVGAMITTSFGPS